MKCSKCQKNLPKDVYVCPYCGHENQPKNKRLSNEDIPSELAHLSIAQLQKRIKKLNMLDHYKMVILGAIVVLVVIFVILGISRPRWKNQTVNNFHDDITEISNVNAAGNAAFNITNGGNIVLAGESIYMTDKDGLVYKGDLGLTEPVSIFMRTSYGLLIRIMTMRSANIIYPAERRRQAPIKDVSFT